jgi:hypothetical protein
MLVFLLGPGAYKPEEAGPMKTVFQSPPAYTFGTRHKNYGLDNTPGRII